MNQQNSARKTAFIGMMGLALGSSLSPGLGQAEEESYYNEVYDDNGNPRHGYDAIINDFKRLSPSKKKRLLQQTKRDFGNDNMLDPVPRLLTESEFNQLSSGTAQRGKAIQMFLSDVQAGNPDVTSIVPKPVLDRIISRSLETPYIGKVNPDAVAFPYGPDIIRDAEGQWRVIEDNPGFIGGLGDLKVARKSLLKRMPGYKEKLEPAHPAGEYYAGQVKKARELRNPPDGKVVFFSVPPYLDHEESRLKRMYKKLGVEIVTPFSTKSLVIDPDGSAHLERKLKSGKVLRESVGYVMIHAEHTTLDISYPPTYERAVVDTAREALQESEEAYQKLAALPTTIKEQIAAAQKPDPKTGKVDLEKLNTLLDKHDPDRKDRLTSEAKEKISAAMKPNPNTGKVDLGKLRSVLDIYDPGNTLNKLEKVMPKGLTEAIVRGKLPSNFSPSTEFIGDKEFYVYVEKMIRHYLKEEPILKNIPTESFYIYNGDKVSVNQELLDRVFADQKNYVIKAVDGRGGDAVWVGAKISPERLQAVKAKILAEPERFIAQKFTPLSRSGDNIVDLRMISQVDRHGVLVSTTPWGRGLPKDGNGKVNLSDQGRELAVIVIKDPKPRAKTGRVCDQLYTPLAGSPAHR